MSLKQQLSTVIPVFFSCSCQAGFKGERCEININDCLDHGCLNEGVCVDGVQSYTCQCPLAYRGMFTLELSRTTESKLIKLSW